MCLLYLLLQSNAKVSDAQFSDPHLIVDFDEDVLRLEVEMHHALLVAVLDTFGDHTEDGPDLFLNEYLIHF